MLSNPTLADLNASDPSEKLIQIEDVSKVYRIWKDPKSRLQHPLLNAVGAMLPFSRLGLRNPKHKAKELFRDFYALKNVSFAIGKGESVGILGKNGSGKSTLLQIIAGTLQPTFGSVKVQGRIAALLELGSGFNPEFTGRENVYLNASIIGLSRKETDARFASIVEFADIGDFLDQPVKTYSSGMMVRLAFSVQVAVEPDLLIIDEALSVGDVFFQQKCFSRIRDMQKKGTSLLFVSHDTAAVQNLCSRAILLEKGQQIFIGSPEETVSRYYRASSLKKATSSNTLKHAPTARRPALAELLDAHNIRSNAKSEHGARDLEISRIGVFDSDGKSTMNFKVGDKLHLAVELSAKSHIGDPSVGIHLFDRMNNLIFASGTRQLRQAFGNFLAGEKRIIEFVLELSIQPGLYTFSAGCSQPSDDPNAGFIQHRLEGLGPITVSPATSGIWEFYGLARLPLEIEVHG